MDLEIISADNEKIYEDVLSLSATLVETISTVEYSASSNVFSLTAPSCDLQSVPGELQISNAKKQSVSVTIV